MTFKTSTLALAFALFGTASQAATITINGLPSASSLTGTELIPIWQGGVTKNATAAAIAALASGSYTLPTASTTTLGGVKVDGTTITITGGVISSTGGTSYGTGVATALGLALNGSGALSATTSPAFVTPSLGAATGTSLAIGGATLGSNALAVSGLANFASAGTAAAPSVSVGNQTTGLYSVGTTGFAVSVNGGLVADWGISNTTWNFHTGLYVDNSGNIGLNAGGAGLWGSGVGMRVTSGHIYGFVSGSNATLSADTAISRIAPGVIGVGTGAAGSTAGTLKAAAILPGVVYSAAGTPLPSCVAGINGQQATVSDATAPTWHGTYASGGAVVSPVYCNGTNWLTY